MPHALIAAYGGDTVAAAKHFADWAPADMNVTVLVDFENDSVRTALEVARRARRPALGRPARHVGVARRPVALGGARRLPADGRQPAARLEGARRARRARASSDVRIVVSGGFTVEKIREFEENGVPVDAYGVGSSLIRGSNDFTADIVVTDGKPSAKVGRALPAELAARARHVRRILWDVDTQVDFVRADGKLVRPRRRGGAAGDGAARRRRRARPGSRTSRPPTTTS